MPDLIKVRFKPKVALVRYGSQAVPVGDTCSLCGALVADKAKHVAWHASLTGVPHVTAS